MNRVAFGLLVAAVLVPSRSMAQSQMVIAPDTTRSIYVTGHGSVSTSPDTASAELGVFAVDLDARKAKAVVDAAVGRIVALAQGLGIPTEALKTAALNIEPRYAQDQPTKLLGYEVTRSVTAVLRDLTKLDAFLDGAVQAGANRNFDISVSSSQEERLRREALAHAIDDARAQAVASAEQLGVRLASVRSVNLNPSGGSAHLYTMASYSTGPSAKFLPGTIRIGAEVSVTFTIEDKTGKQQ